MANKELLKSMLHNLINDNTDQASQDLHNYLTPKTREVAGLSSANAVPVNSYSSIENDTDDNDD